MDRKKYFSLKSNFYKKSINDFLYQIPYNISKFKDSENIFFHYKTFFLKKTNGKFREINSSIGELKLIQKELANYLLLNRSINDCSHAFEINKSIVSNAKMHINRNIVLNIDIKDFFGSINKQMVSEMFSSKFKVDGDTLILLTNLCTYKNKLPQGAPTSSVISNFICDDLDKKLKKFSIKNRINYSRYADDLTFSFNNKKLPISKVDEIIQIITEFGFILNDSKFRYFYKNKRQVVTGLVVNDKVNIDKVFLKKLRAILFNWKHKGYFFCNQEFKKQFGQHKDMLSTLNGWINFVGNVRGANDSKYLKLKEDFSKLSKLYLMFYENVQYNVPINLAHLKKKINKDHIPLNYLIENDIQSSVWFQYIDNEQKLILNIPVKLVYEVKENPEILFSIASDFKFLDGKEFFVLNINKYLNF